MRSTKLAGYFLAFFLAAPALYAQVPAPKKRSLDGASTMNDAKLLTPSVPLPASVRKVLNESVVTVLIDRSVHGVQDLDPNGMGFFVRPTLVLTRYHVIDPAHTSSRIAVMRRGVKIVRSGLVYDARVVYFDKSVDLLLLSVPDTYGYVATISGNDLDPSNALPNYFSFGCGPDDLTEYYLEHYQFYGYRPADRFYGPFPISGRFGMVEGHMRAGFSGSPLIDARGIIYGDLFGSVDEKPFSTLFTPGNDILNFVATAIHFLNQEKGMHYARLNRPALR